MDTNKTRTWKQRQPAKHANDPKAFRDIRVFRGQSCPFVNRGFSNSVAYFLSLATCSFCQPQSMPFVP